MNGITVVKLGGSFAFCSELRCWVDAVAASRARVVIVPGGGPFADTVRAAQQKIGFDDRAAHHMAVLAMEQYGRALVALNDRLGLASTKSAILQAVRAGKIPVWSPLRMVLAAEDIPSSWDVTSDSLAAWLAGRIGAKGLILVKQAKVPAAALRVHELVAGGIVDRAFPRFGNGAEVSAAIVGPGTFEEFGSAIRNGAVVGTPILMQ